MPSMEIRGFGQGMEICFAKNFPRKKSARSDDESSAATTGNTTGAPSPDKANPKGGSVRKLAIQSKDAHNTHAPPRKQLTRTIVNTMALREGQSSSPSERPRGGSPDAARLAAVPGRGHRAGTAAWTNSVALPSPHEMESQSVTPFNSVDPHDVGGHSLSRNPAAAPSRSRGDVSPAKYSSRQSGGGDRRRGSSRHTSLRRSRSRSRSRRGGRLSRGRQATAGDRSRDAGRTSSRGRYGRRAGVNSRSPSGDRLMTKLSRQRRSRERESPRKRSPARRSPYRRSRERRSEGSWGPERRSPRRRSRERRSSLQRHQSPQRRNRHDSFELSRKLPRSLRGDDSLDRQQGGRRPSRSRTGRVTDGNHNSPLPLSRDVERDGWRGDDVSAHESQRGQAYHGPSSDHRARPAFGALESNRAEPAGHTSHARHGIQEKSRGDVELLRSARRDGTVDGHLGDGLGSRGIRNEQVGERGRGGRPSSTAVDKSRPLELGAIAAQVLSERPDKRRLVDSEQGSGRASLLHHRGNGLFDIDSVVSRNVDCGDHGFQGNSIPPPRKGYTALTPGNANGYGAYDGERLGGGHWEHGGEHGGLGSEMAKEREEVAAPEMLPHPPAARPLPAVAARAQGARLMIKGTHPAVPERRIHALASDFGVVGKIEVLEVKLMASNVDCFPRCSVHELDVSHQLGAAQNVRTTFLAMSIDCAGRYHPRDPLVDIVKPLPF